MKRPEGFDRRPEPQPTPSPKREPKAPRLRRPSADQPAVAPRVKPNATKTTTPVLGESIETVGQGAKITETVKNAETLTSAESAKSELKKAIRQRKRYEKSEARRFTRRSRRRRVTWLVSLIVAVVVVGAVTAAVYSPLLALKTISIEGSSRVNSNELKKAVGGQVGTPLALLDFTKIKHQLSKYPLIRSYVTEVVPPATLVIRIAERTPLAAIATATGFETVDAAGVVLESATDRPANLPVVDTGSAVKGSPAFAAAISVLLALPPDFLKKVDSVSAQTIDNVTLTLTGSAQSIVWGSAEDSAAKARVLAILIAQQPQASRFDVSAPSNPVFAR